MKAGHVADIRRPTMSVPPFIAIPARAAQSPRTTTVPPRIDAAAPLPALPRTTHRPREHALGQAPAGAAVDLDGRAVVHPGAVVADAAGDVDAPGVEQGHAEVVAGPGVADLDRPTRGERGPDRPIEVADRLAATVDPDGRGARPLGLRLPRPSFRRRRRRGRRSAARRRKTWPDGSCATPADPRAVTDGHLLVGDRDVVGRLDRDERLQAKGSRAYPIASAVATR